MVILQAAQNPAPPISVWTVIAAIAAILSAVSAFRSSRFAKRALSITTQTYQDRQANFSLYLVDGYRWSSNDADKRKFLLFHISVINKSDSKSSFKAELEIEYIRTDQSVARAIITHEESLQSHILNKSLSVFPNDIRIDEKGRQSNWLIFEQPTLAFKEYRIDKYAIRIIDTHGNMQTIDSAILKEMNYA